MHLIIPMPHFVIFCVVIATELNTITKTIMSNTSNNWFLSLCPEEKEIECTNCSKIPFTPQGSRFCEENSIVFANSDTFGVKGILLPLAQWQPNCLAIFLHFSSCIYYLWMKYRNFIFINIISLQNNFNI